MIGTCAPGGRRPPRAAPGHPPPPPPPGQVALRGGQEVRREALGAHGRRPAPGMAAVLREATRTVPQAAAAVLLHMGEAGCGPRGGIVLPCGAELARASSLARGSIFYFAQGSPSKPACRRF
jgi:hypothetical protein